MEQPNKNWLAKQPTFSSIGTDDTAIDSPVRTLSVPSINLVPISRPSSAPGHRNDDGRVGINCLHKAPSVANLPDSPGPQSIQDVPPSSDPDQPAEPAKPGIFKSAFDNTLHFASGLISAPWESTWNYTIVRHSLGLIFYHGPNTTVSVSILANKPLAPTRKLYLQRRGLTGNMGMNFAATFGSSAMIGWIDVTPAQVATVKDVSGLEERGYQRDMARFARKGSRSQRKHLPRETHIVRIPAAAQDGYFRLMLCKGDVGGGPGKVLCSSPVFRLASTSTDASILRGASLMSLPVEVGVKVASLYANNTVGRVVAPLAGTAGAVVQKTVGTAAAKTAKKVMPNAKVRQMAGMAYDAVGVEDRAREYENRYHDVRDARYDALHDDGIPVVGSDEGPEAPFPIQFEGTVVKGTGKGKAELGLPTVNISGVRDEVKMRMKGVFFGWAAVQPKKGVTGLSHEWHEAIIAIGALPNASPTVVARPKVTAHLVHDFDGAMFYDMKVKVIALGFLRRQLSTSELANPDLQLVTMAKDIEMTVASLGRENWEPNVAIGAIKKMKKERGVGDRYMDARGKVQTGLDKVPIHAAGVRTSGAAKRDRVHGIGGVWIPR